jgi:hypothetical protein
MIRREPLILELRHWIFLIAFLMMRNLFCYFGHQHAYMDGWGLLDIIHEEG